MARERRDGPVALGHVAVYARDGRWRRALARSLDDAGHSHHEAGTAAELRRLLMHQRFDAMALRVRDAREASELEESLGGVTLPPHGILVGGAGARLLSLRHKRNGTLRYVPASLPAKDVSRLIDVGLSAHAWDEGGNDHGAAAQVEQVDVEELIEAAAAAVYPRARRKQQRFSSVVDDPIAHVTVDPTHLRRAVVALLRLSVLLAPRGALVAVEARAGRDDWSVRIHASNGRRREPAQVAEALAEEARTLSAVSREMQSQGGLVWAELLGSEGFAFCLALPLPAGAEQSA
jgi:signal transduction histidine kinase